MHTESGENIGLLSDTYSSIPLERTAYSTGRLIRKSHTRADGKKSASVSRVNPEPALKDAHRAYATVDHEDHPAGRRWSDRKAVSELQPLIGARSQLPGQFNLTA
jgi:hypothetical protein